MAEPPTSFAETVRRRYGWERFSPSQWPRRVGVGRWSGSSDPPRHASAAHRRRSRSHHRPNPRLVSAAELGAAPPPEAPVYWVGPRRDGVVRAHAGGPGPRVRPVPLASPAAAWLAAPRLPRGRDLCAAERVRRDRGRGCEATRRDHDPAGRTAASRSTTGPARRACSRLPRDGRHQIEVYAPSAAAGAPARCAAAPSRLVPLPGVATHRDARRGCRASPRAAGAGSTGPAPARAA